MVRPAISKRLAALIGVGLLLVAALWLGWSVYLRWAIRSELQTVALKKCVLQRFGSANDGGYVMCENLPESIDAAYSYGVGHNDDWGCEVSRRYRVPVHQYDCFSPARPSCDGGTFIFHNECVGSEREQVDSRMFDTLESQLKRNGDAGKRLLVKIDIEAAEWDALLATPDALLASIPQLAMELHGYDDRKIIQVLRKLKRHFHLVNVHFNNWSCTRRAWPMKGWAYQVLFVNKNLDEVDRSAPVLSAMSPPNASDAPNLPECQFEATR